VLCTGVVSTGMLSVPVRCTGALCTTWIGAACWRFTGERPVAITVTRSWSPSVSS